MTYLCMYVLMCACEWFPYSSQAVYLCMNVYTCICVMGATWVHVCVAGAYAMGAAVCDDHSAVVAAVSASHDVLHRHCRDLRKREGS